MKVAQPNTAAKPKVRMARKGAPPKGKGMVSKKQWKWAYATHQPWAHRHAEHTERTTGYKALPTRKGAPTTRTPR